MKKTIAIVLTLALCLGALAGCGSKKDSADKTITVAASPTPHAEILKVAGEVLAKDGWTLKVTEYADYVVPNNVVEDGECDANYFQHQPYLDTFNKENNTHLVSVAAIHYEPFGIYAGTKSSIADLADGDKIAIPNDGSNRARALLLLEANGILKLKEGVGMEATALDITESTPKVAIVEMATEDPNSVSAQTYANVLVVKEGSEKTEKTQALVKALTSQEVKDYINNTYSGAVVPIF